MRTIKFRCWDKEKKKMLSWNEIISIGNPETELFISSLCATKRLDWMQYTGLKDKKGKEIYEGDIVKDDERSLRVVWDTGMYELQSRDGLYITPIGTGRDVEIIGNIYENKDSLK